jgi:hypothetical protein
MSNPTQAARECLIFGRYPGAKVTSSVDAQPARLREVPASAKQDPASKTAELHVDIDRTREQLSQTVEALAHKVDVPAQVKAKAPAGFGPGDDPELRDATAESTRGHRRIQDQHPAARLPDPGGSWRVGPVPVRGAPARRAGGPGQRVGHRRRSTRGAGAVAGRAARRY